MGLYTALIQQHLPTTRHYDPSDVEAWMRLEHSTLDGLSARAFQREVTVACACIDAAAPEETAELRRSYGLG